MSRRRSTPPTYTRTSEPGAHHSCPPPAPPPRKPYPHHYSRSDIERIAHQLAMVWDEQHNVRLGPQVAKLCEAGLRMLLSEPTRKEVMDILRCERCAPDPDGPACAACVARTNEIVRIFQDQRRKDWSL